MPLILIAHRILIGAAIAFGILYTVWEALAFRQAGEAMHLVAALVAAVLTLGLGYYLRHLRRFVAHR
jgi:hypothetical protein